MGNLMRANLQRIFKNKFYLAFLAFVLVFSLWFLFYNYEALSYYENAVPEEHFFEALSCAPFAFAAFVPLYVGREFSDNTIRNKILAGHTRLAIFSAAVLSSAIGCITMLLVYAVPQVTLGFMLLGLPTMPEKLALSFLGLMILTVFWSAIMTAIVFLGQNKSVCAIASFILVTIMIFVGAGINDALSQPETFWTPAMDDDFIINTEPSELVETENPYYVGGYERRKLEFLSRTDPAGQFFLLGSLENDRPELTCLAGCAESIIVYALGALMFKKRNIS